MVNFSKSSDASLHGIQVLQFGAAWDRKTGKQTAGAAKLSRFTGGRFGQPKAKAVDLDLALVLYRDGEPKRLVIGHNPDPVNGTVVHSGDNQTGEGSGDDETIRVMLDVVPAWVTEWAVAVTAFKPGTNFDNAQNVSLNVYDDSDRNDGRAILLDELMPTLGSGHNAVVVATGKRNRGREGEPLDGWTTRLVDRSGRLSAQGQDAALMDFIKQNAGI